MEENNLELQENQNTVVCAKCGSSLDEEQLFCPKCGTPRNADSGKNVCGKCGTELQQDQEFCPKCGQRAGLTVDSGVLSAIDQFNETVEKKKSRKIIIPVIIVALAVAAAIAYVILVPAVDSISLAQASLELKTGDSQTVTYTIEPKKAGKAGVTWESSNDSVAAVNSNGKIKAKSEGTCTITATAGGKTAAVSVVVKDTIDFMKQYGKYKDENWCEIAEDGSWMKLDTNPTNADSDDVWKYYDAFMGVSELMEKIHKDLGFKSSLTEKMNSTTALQGRQSESNEDYEVSWSYHPDKGLEIMYEAK